MSLFELGSLHHDYYLLNVRLPNDPFKNENQDLGHVTDLLLTVSYVKLSTVLVLLRFSSSDLVLNSNFICF